LSEILSKSYIGLHVQYPLLFSDFKETSIFLDIISKNLQKSNLMKIRPVGAALFHTDRQTDMTKQIVAFRNFAKST